MAAERRPSTAKYDKLPLLVAAGNDRVAQSDRGTVTQSGLVQVRILPRSINPRRSVPMGARQRDGRARRDFERAEMPLWILGQDGEPELRAMYERHYSCHHYKDGRKPIKFVGPGEYILLTTPTRSALFVWKKFDDAIQPPQEGICCSVFRNESKAARSSDLIREADAIADFCWPGQRHYTTVCPEAVTSRNPGWCFICAGWNLCETTKGGLVILERT